MAKGKGQRIGGAFFEIGADNTGLKDVLDDSLRSVTGAVGALAAIGKGGVGGAVTALGPVVAGAAAFGGATNLAIEQQGTFKELQRQMGRQGGTKEDFESARQALRDAVSGRPVSVGELLPTLVEAFKGGGLNPRDFWGIRGLLNETIGGVFATGSSFDQVGKAFIDAQARGQMGGLIAAGFQGINPDPRFTEENLKRARGQAYGGLQAEEAERRNPGRIAASIWSNIKTNLTELSADMVGLFGGLTLGQMTDVSNVTFGRATGLSAAERRTGMGGLQENNPAFGQFPGEQQEDIDLRERTKRFFDRESEPTPMQGPSLIQPSGSLSERAEEQISLLQQIRDNTAKPPGEMSFEDADALARQKAFDGFIDSGTEP